MLYFYPSAPGFFEKKEKKALDGTLDKSMLESVFNHDHNHNHQHRRINQRYTYEYPLRKTRRNESETHIYISYIHLNGTKKSRDTKQNHGQNRENYPSHRKHATQHVYVRHVHAEYTCTRVLYRHKSWTHSRTRKNHGRSGGRGAQQREDTLWLP